VKAAKFQPKAIIFDVFFYELKFQTWPFLKLFFDFQKFFKKEKNHFLILLNTASACSKVNVLGGVI
jgi:hypothetical protein